MYETVKKNAAQTASPQPPCQDCQPPCPSHITDNELFDPRTEKIICMTARRLVRPGRFQQYENDDIKQKLRIALWQQMRNFDPTLSSRYTFATMVCRRTAINLINSLARSQAKGTCEVSLEQEVGQGDCTLGDCISSEYYSIALGRQNRRDVQHLELRDAIDATLARFPEGDADICRHIMEGNSLRAIARTRGCPFSTLNNHFRNHVAPMFTRALGGME